MKEQFPYNNRPESWQEIESRVVCHPDCKRGGGFKQFEKRIEHDTVIYVVQCQECGAKAMDWGYDNYAITGDPEMTLTKSQKAAMIKKKTDEQI